MRKIIALAFITLDGVMQAPGGPGEDTEGGFKYGGWTAPYGDEASGKVMQKIMEPADLLLGRKTFEIFANHWPQHAEHWPGINEVTKYFLSNTIKASDPIAANWKNCVALTSLEDIKKLKASEGGEIKIWGSSKLVHLLLKHDLVDELWLQIHPIILGEGKKLFASGAHSGAYKLAECHVIPTGVIMAHYTRAGEVKTGTVEE
jgi:dihydrofolate reductase